MNKKRGLIALAILALGAASTFAQYSYKNNTYQKLADEYARKSEAAFDAGYLDDAMSYAQLAEENAQLSRAFIDQQTAGEEVAKLFAQAGERIKWAKDNGVDKSSPMAFSSANEAYLKAQENFENGEFDLCRENSLIVINTLKDVKGEMVLPEYYIVRSWKKTKDCLWNIAKRPYVYNNPHLWENLYQVNKQFLVDKNNPNLIMPGMKVRIPSINGEIREGVYDPKKKYPTFGEK